MGNDAHWAWENSFWAFTINFCNYFLFRIGNWTPTLFTQWGCVENQPLCEVQRTWHAVHFGIYCLRKISKVNGDSTWWTVRGSSKRLWLVHGRGETRWQGEEWAVKIPEWSCLACGADGFWGSGKIGLLQCKNQRNFWLELGCFRGRWSGGLLSDIAPVPRTREAHNSQEKRHLLKQKLYTEQTSGSKPDREYCTLWSKEMNVPAPAPCYEMGGHWGASYLWWDKGRDFKSEQMVTYFKDIIEGESSGQMFSQRHRNTAPQWQENMQKMCGC